MPSGATSGAETSAQSAVTDHRAKLMRPSDPGQEEIRSKALPAKRSVGRSSCPHPHDLHFGPLCGLCFFQDGFASELPTRLHAYKILADNGNPETSPKFLAHLQVTFGIRPPEPGQSLHQFRAQRRLASSPAPGIYPIASVIWEMMGNQPPLAHPFYLAVIGVPEAQIASRLEISQYNLWNRLAKATRYAMRLYYGRYSTSKEPPAEPDLSRRAAELRGSEQAADGAAGAQDYRPAVLN